MIIQRVAELKKLECGKTFPLRRIYAYVLAL